MKRTLFLLLFVLPLLAACGPTPDISTITPPFIETGIDPAAWALVPAGAFPYGQHDQLTQVPYDFEIMVTDVTNGQYAAFLNEALPAGVVRVGEVTVEAGENRSPRIGVVASYPGEPFDGYRHEEEIRAGDKLLVPLDEEGLRLTYDGDAFAAIDEYTNHPMTMVSWFGANAYCDFYGYHLPLEIEWEKAARGTDTSVGRGRPFPWGASIAPNQANYYSSFDLFEKLFGKLGNTTPVALYNGRTYDGYETLDAASPYGLYDMAGNVWQWTGDDYPNQHYRYLRGGSFYSYEVDLRVWKRNSAGPTYFGPAIGFRCARSPVAGESPDAAAQ